MLMGDVSYDLHAICGNRGTHPRFRYPIFINIFNSNLFLSENVSKIVKVREFMTTP